MTSWLNAAVFWKTFQLAGSSSTLKKKHFTVNKPQDQMAFLHLYQKYVQMNKH